MKQLVLRKVGVLLTRSAARVVISCVWTTTETSWHHNCQHHSVGNYW